MSVIPNLDAKTSGHAIKAFLAATTLPVTLVTGQARADEKGGLLLGAANVTIAKCIAPTINPSVEADFNYFADAITLTADFFASKEEEDRGNAAAIKLFEQEGEAAFFERGGRALAADLHTLFRTTTASGYETAKATYLARIRRIDPELEKRVSARTQRRNGRAGRRSAERRNARTSRG